MVGGTAVLAGLGFALAALLGPGEAPVRPASSEAPAEIRGLRATLVDRARRHPAGGFAWTTAWRLCWEPVPGAHGYLVTLVTAEGVDPRPRATARTCFRLTVASGTAARRGGRAGRAGQLDLMQSMLSVSVAARMRDGSTGPAAPDIPVGQRYSGMR